MYLRDLAASCLRRWYLVLACLLISVGLCLYAADNVDPSFETSASVVLIPPENPEDPRINRYLSLGGLSESTDVLARSLMSDRTHKVIDAKTRAGEYDVVADWSTRAPILIVTAKAPRKADAQKMLDAVLARVPVTLEDLQTALDIEESAQITTVLVSSDDAPEAVQKTRYRIVGGLAALCALASAVLVAAVDGLLLRRSRRKGAREGMPTDGPADGGDHDPLLSAERLDALDWQVARDEELPEPVQPAGQKGASSVRPSR